MPDVIDQRYLKQLSKEFPTAMAAAAEIINLRAILSLPKGTEYFFSDLHGEHEAFIHMLKSASGMIRSKIDDLFQKSVSVQERTALAALIYEPERELARVRAREGENFGEWCRIAIYRLVQVCKTVSSKYTRSKVRKNMPGCFQYIIDELLHFDDDESRSQYYSEIMRAIVDTGMEAEFLTSLCGAVRQLTIDKLHILGDVFDRGPHPDLIMNELMQAHDVDIQWGNHDISWMGAAAGNYACIANVIRLGISYNTFDLLEDGYGINLRPLSMFAARMYRDDPCAAFVPHLLDENKYDPVDRDLAAKMHKAIAVIQFKLEGTLVRRHPEYGMEGRDLLGRVDFSAGTVNLNGKNYPMLDRLFPTVNPNDPLTLTEEENDLMQVLAVSFSHSELLQKHMRFLYSHGSMYRSTNTKLLYHGCIPMRADGSFDEVSFGGQTYSGRSYLDFIDGQVRRAYFAPEGSGEKRGALDFLWFLWCGAKSPLFGKSKMSAFEHYFIADKSACKEEMNPYYRLVESRDVCEKLLLEFGLNPENSHVINGHVPVRIKQGENPVKGGGLLFFIDGGISKAYQEKTGIAGYTFLYSSRFIALAQHKPFVPRGENGLPVENAPSLRIVELMRTRVRVADTATGQELALRINDLQGLLEAYRSGSLKEL